MGTLRTFGPAHGSPDLPTCPVPVGQKCIWCEEMFVDGDQGLLDAGDAPQHRECFFRSIFGSVGHQKGTCSCFGGSEEDPPDMTRRQAARAAMEIFLRTRDRFVEPRGVFQ